MKEFSTFGWMIIKNWCRLTASSSILMRNWKIW